MKKSTNIFSWAFAMIAAVILLQTLFFKFTAAPESVYIFTTLGVEPWGRIFTGILELGAGLLLILPSTRHWGALGAVGIMAGAILSHLFILGIEVQGDGGYLFALAWVVLISASIVGWLKRERFINLFPQHLSA